MTLGDVSYVLNSLSVIGRHLALSTFPNPCMAHCSCELITAQKHFGLKSPGNNKNSQRYARSFEEAREQRQYMLCIDNLLTLLTSFNSTKLNIEPHRASAHRPFALTFWPDQGPGPRPKQPL